MARPEVRTPRLRIGPSQRSGRGVFAERRYAPGELIEMAPVVVVPAGQQPLIAQTVLTNYYFHWGTGQPEDIAIGLGFSSIYNHSFTPNAKYAKHFEAQILEYTALRTIEPGEEIVVNYNGDPRDRTPVWFEAKG